jgi:hypothetical protein
MLSCYYNTVVLYIQHQSLSMPIDKLFLIHYVTIHYLAHLFSQRSPYSDAPSSDSYCVCPYISICLVQLLRRYISWLIATESAACYSSSVTTRISILALPSMVRRSITIASTKQGSKLGLLWPRSQDSDHCLAPHQAGKGLSAITTARASKTIHASLQHSPTSCPSRREMRNL